MRELGAISLFSLRLRSRIASGQLRVLFQPPLQQFFRSLNLGRNNVSNLC